MIFTNPGRARSIRVLEADGTQRGCGRQLSLDAQAGNLRLIS